MMRTPILADVLDARRAIALYLRPAPLHLYPVLDQLVGAEVYVKHENYQPIGGLIKGGWRCEPAPALDGR